MIHWIYGLVKDLHSINTPFSEHDVLKSSSKLLSLWNAVSATSVKDYSVLCFDSEILQQRPQLIVIIMHSNLFSCGITSCAVIRAPIVPSLWKTVKYSIFISNLRRHSTQTILDKTWWNTPFTPAPPFNVGDEKANSGRTIFLGAQHCSGGMGVLYLGTRNWTRGTKVF